MANCTGETILNIRGGVCSAGPPAHPAPASTDFHLKSPLASGWLKPANAWFEGFSLSFATFSFSFRPFQKRKKRTFCTFASLMPAEWNSLGRQRKALKACRKGQNSNICVTINSGTTLSDGPSGSSPPSFSSGQPNGLPAGGIAANTSPPPPN